MLKGEIRNFRRWNDQLKQANIRGVMLIAGNQQDDIRHDSTMKSGIANKLSQYLSNHCLSNKETCLHVDQTYTDKIKTSDKVDKLLGREFHTILFDAREHFDTNLFAALMGTISGAGVLYLILPEVYTKFLNTTKSANETSSLTELTKRLSAIASSPTLNRFIAFTINNSSTAVVSDSACYFPSMTITSTPTPASTSISTSTNNRAKSEQSEIIEQIIRVARGHSRRPLVLSAHRGRGKSAALGIAATKLLEKERVTILVTAPNIRNLDSFYRHLSPTADRKGKLRLANESSLSFMPIDKILQNQDQASLVIVDEAAAIPVSQLSQLTAQYNRVVFSTTTHGYEGNGKGFEIRFKQQLLITRPQTQFAKMNLPMRWSSADELETAGFKAFLLDCELPNTPNLSSAEDYSYFSLSKEHLINDEKLLRQVFSLLVNAHYQTRPADLEQILINPKLSTRVLFDKNRTVVAVALINREGLLDKQTCEDIYQAKKRIPGELLPQSLIANQGMKSMGKYAFHRVMRIAVNPALQSHGLGSQLLKEILHSANDEAISFIGASFAAESKVINFWFKNGYSPIRVGLAKDSSSGAFSCEVLCACNIREKEQVERLTRRFDRSFQYKIRSDFRSIDSQIIFSWLKQRRDPVVCLTTSDKNELYLFGQGARSFSSIDWLLTNLLQLLLRNPSIVKRLQEIDWLLLIDVSYKQIPLTEIAASYHLTGKKQAVSKIRDCVSCLLKIIDSNNNG